MRAQFQQNIELATESTLTWISPKFCQLTTTVETYMTGW